MESSLFLDKTLHLIFFTTTSVYYIAFVSVIVLSVYHQKEAATFVCCIWV